MWCRLLKGEASSGAKGITWQREGELSPAQIPHRPENLYSQLPGSSDFSGVSGGQQIDQHSADAYEKGLQDGEAAAIQKMAEPVNAKITVLARSIEQLALHRAKIQREAEPELVRLALAIARRILRRELTVDPESLLGLLKAGLEKIESSEAHRVRINPEHAGMLAKLLEGSARPVTVVADPALPVGAVLFETSRGTVDAGLETQLKEIERGFADIYPR